MEAKQIYKLEHGVLLYAFDTRAEAEEFCNQEADGILKGTCGTRIPGLTVGIPFAMRGPKDSPLRNFTKVIKFGNDFRVVAYVAWTDD